MVRTYVYMEISEYPSPAPWAYTLPLPFAAFFLLSFGWHHEGLNQILDSTYERYTNRHLTGQVRSEIVQQTFCPLHMYTVHIRIVRYTSVIHQLLIRS